MLLNPWALDENGNFVSIEHAQKNQEYFCPTCHQPLTYRKKGDGPRAHQDHFSHKRKSNCSGPSESYIHKFAKQGVHDILHSAIVDHRDILISWTCPKCGMEFKANLLTRAKSVVMEKNLGEAQADVALLDENEKVMFAIEIVYTHDVESKTLEFYEDNRVVLIRIVIRSAEDCNDLMHKLQYPDSVNVCFKANCPNCQSQQQFRKIIKITNKENLIVGFAVGMINPFNGELIKGLPFNETERQKVINLVNTKWPSLQLRFYDDATIPHALLEQKTIPIPRSRPYSRYRGSRIDYIDSGIERQQSRPHYRSNQGKRKSSPSKKKSGGGRRRR